LESEWYNPAGFFSIKDVCLQFTSTARR